MQNKKMLNESLKKLDNYIKNENLLGYDPYDYLKSPLFSYPFIKNRRIIKFISQQIGKRLPFNIRGFLGIEKGLNPTTLGLVIKGYLNLYELENDKDYVGEINNLISNVEEKQSTDYEFACWGYDFEWQGRYTKFPENTPNIIVTSIIIDSIYNYLKIKKDPDLVNLCLGAAEFVLNNLNRVENSNEICFSYSPLDNQKVYNANMKAARLLIQVYDLTRKEEYFEAALKACNYVMKRQHEDGSWPYSNGDQRKWIDNFHTGYILECIDEWRNITGSNIYDEKIEKGFSFYKNNFFKKDAIPKYYNDELYPIDSTSAAQSIIVLSRFKEYKLAEAVINWMIENMQSTEGYFYYQQKKYWTNKISYMRWSNAWMFLALTEFIKRDNNDMV